MVFARRLQDSRYSITLHDWSAVSAKQDGAKSYWHSWCHIVLNGPAFPEGDSAPRPGRRAIEIRFYHATKGLLALCTTAPVTDRLGLLGSFGWHTLQVRECGGPFRCSHLERRGSSRCTELIEPNTLRPDEIGLYSAGAEVRTDR